MLKIKFILLLAFSAELCVDTGFEKPRQFWLFMHLFSTAVSIMILTIFTENIRKINGKSIKEILALL